MKTTIQKKQASSLFSVECGEQRPLPPAPTSVAAPEPHRSLPVVPLIADKRYYGEAPARPAGGSGAGWEEPGAIGSTVWGARLGSDGSPRRGRRVKGQSRGTVWRVIGISGYAGERCPIFRHLRGPQLHKPNRLWQPGRLRRVSPGITLVLPGAPPASAGPRDIAQAYGQGAEGSFPVLGHSGKWVSDGWQPATGEGLPALPCTSNFRQLDAALRREGRIRITVY